MLDMLLATGRVAKPGIPASRGPGPQVCGERIEMQKNPAQAHGGAVWLSSGRPSSETTRLARPFATGRASTGKAHTEEDTAQTEDERHHTRPRPRQQTLNLHHQRRWPTTRPTAPGDIPPHAHHASCAHPSRKVRRVLPGLAYGLALDVRPAGAAEVSRVTGAPKARRAKRKCEAPLISGGAAPDNTRRSGNGLAATVTASAGPAQPSMWRWYRSCITHGLRGRSALQVLGSAAAALDRLPRGAEQAASGESCG